MYNNLQRKPDGTFIFDFKGYSFHVTPEYPTAEQYGEDMTYSAISAYADLHPDEVSEYIEPILEMPELRVEELRNQEITILKSRASDLSLRVQAGLSEQDIADSQAELKTIMIELESLQLETT